MGKKGKGKGKGKSGDQPTERPRSQEQASSSSVGRGRGRGAGARSSAAEPPGVSQTQEAKKPVESGDRAVGATSQQQDAPKGPPEKQFFESGDKPVGVTPLQPHTPKGRGRGRGSPQQSATPVSPGVQEQKGSPKGSLADYPELPASGSKVEPLPQDTSVKKKIVSREEQEELLSKVASIKLEHKAEVIKHMKFAERPTDLPVINDRNRIKLFVNYFKLDFKDNIVIYHYDIDISDSTKDNKVGKSVLAEGRTAKDDIKKKVKHVEREKRRNMGKAKCRQIISDVFRNTPALRQFCPVYDGQKNLFTSKPLPVRKEPFPVDIMVDDNPNNRKRFYVTITPVSKEDNTNIISLEPLINLYRSRIKMTEIPYEVLLVYDTVMKHREPPFTQVNFRNSFFDLYDRKDPLGCGLEVWFGYHQNVQLTELGPVVVINLAAKAFHKAGSVIEYANDVLQSDITRLPKLQNWQISSLTDSLRGVQVKVTHQNIPRKYKIKQVTDRSADDIIIDYENRRVSITQYFLQKYTRRLLHPHLPCLLMQTSSNNTYMPMETCEITQGQPKIGKLNAELTSKMIRGTAVPPQRRMDSVSRTANKVNNVSRQYMQAFGLIMNVRLTEVDGRIMAAPQLAYATSPDGRHNLAKPDNKGVWRVEDGKKFFKVNKIEKWLLISFANERQYGHNVLSKYCEFLCKSARKCGMQLDRPLSIDIYGRNVTTEQALTKAKKSGAQFAIVVLNRRDNYHTYDQVKFLADFKYNLVTQCMEDKTLSRINDQITTNVCLKINVKLGGINHVLFEKPKIFSEPVTVLGIDAIHWGRGYGYPSIISVVGSLNPSASRYALICDLQRNEKQDRISQEIIRDMCKISKEILKAFQAANNNMPPRRIVVFRDGVSEGQFQHALDYEVSGIQEACKELYGKILHITFIVVQKRHHTRFFPANPSQGVGRNQNVPPGTCVDRQITHPVFFDYFICSHEGIQGTSKPAHYTVLHNDNKFSTEDLQNLCYFLCHTYVRCTRSVSLPAPVMYADLAAFRAKKYADLFITSENMSVSSGDEPKDLPPEVERAIRSMRSFENNMFYV